MPFICFSFFHLLSVSPVLFFPSLRVCFGDIYLGYFSLFSLVCCLIFVSIALLPPLRSSCYCLLLLLLLSSFTIIISITDYLFFFVFSYCSAFFWQLFWVAICRFISEVFFLDSIRGKGTTIATTSKTIITIATAASSCSLSLSLYFITGPLLSKLLLLERLVCRLFFSIFSFLHPFFFRATFSFFSRFYYYYLTLPELKYKAIGCNRYRYLSTYLYL